MDWAFFHYLLGCVPSVSHGGVLMNWFEKTFTEFGQRVICTVLLLILAVLVLGWE
jgi:hypothetical protein